MRASCPSRAKLRRQRRREPAVIAVEYRVITVRGSTDRQLIRRWLTDDVTRVPRGAHARYSTTDDGRWYIVGFDEHLCQHGGDFAECIEQAENTHRASAKLARPFTHA